MDKNDLGNKTQQRHVTLASVEPVAWTHVGPGGGRVFYTSLGHPYDFGITQFRQMLRNAIYWAAEVKPTASKDKDDDDSC